jgi:RNA polymerase sigma-70 factor (ECF subfamily)
MSRPSVRTAICPDTLNRLILATAAQDQAAFAALYDLTRRKLFGIALTVLRRRDLAEDVLQEAYIRIWRSASRFDPARGTALTWMGTIVRNLAIDVKRAPAAATDEAALMVIPFNGRNPLDEVEASDDARRLRRAIETLDPMKRKLVIAAYIQGQSREQLSERFGAPVNTIKTWLRRAVIDMRAALQAEGGNASTQAAAPAIERRA